MKCQKCVDAGLRSKVYAPNGGVSTSMAFATYYDEDGFYHMHDPNIHTETWSCSNSHRWSRSWQVGCPALNCEWNAKRMDKIAWE
jgi:hypothetical protein